MAGILEHIADMSLVTNPLVNSYKRLVPGFLAPLRVSWSVHNSSPLIRLTSVGGDGGRIILRSPDGAANPYLVLAACLAAGMDGIKRNLQPPVCMDKMSKEELAKREKLPRTLYEAVKRFENDAFLRDVLGVHVSNYLISTKDAEWEEYCRQVTRWETDRYLGTV